jgi:hypothetical protein
MPKVFKLRLFSLVLCLWLVTTDLLQALDSHIALVCQVESNTGIGAHGNPGPMTPLSNGKKFVVDVNATNGQILVFDGTTRLYTEGNNNPSIDEISRVCWDNDTILFSVESHFTSCAAPGFCPLTRSSRAIIDRRTGQFRTTSAGCDRMGGINQCQSFQSAGHCEQIANDQSITTSTRSCTPTSENTP